MDPKPQRTVMVRLAEDAKLRLQELAKSNDRTLSGELSRAVRSHLERERECDTRTR